MDGLIGPADRWVYKVGPSDVLKAIKNTPAKMFLDEQLTQAAPITTTIGDLIEESTVTTDIFSRWPLFGFPVIDDVKIDTLFASIAGGPVVALYARVDDQIDTLHAALDALVARVAAIEPGGESEAASAEALAELADAVALLAPDNTVVHKTGAETIAGVKTFSASPVVPLTPTTSQQTASKGYVDTTADAAQTAAAQRVNHTGDTKQIQLIFDGDSITAGSQSTNGMTYPAQTAEGLESRAIVTNIGVGGQTVANMLSDVVAQVDPMYSASKLNVVLVGGGTNDLYISGGTITVDALYANYVAYHTARRAVGFKTIAITLLPRTEVGTPANFEDKRQDFNTRVRANWATFADALMDVGADATIGAPAASDNTTYFADKTHPTNAGYAVIARYARAALATLGVVGLHDHAQYQPATNRLWVGANRFVAQSGTPTLEGALFRLPAWSMDPATDEIVSACVDLPRDWKTYVIDFYWGNCGAGAGDVRWTIFYNSNVLVDAVTPLTNTASSFFVETAPAVSITKVRVNSYGTSLPVIASALTALRIQRFGSNVNDTLANDAAFLGLMLRKLS
jgi:lysophospholipase L1-like esterase